MSHITAIDPGPKESALTVIGRDLRPLHSRKIPNRDVLHGIRHGVVGRFIGRPVIEMVASYGMPVGREVFETCVWIGRYQEAILARAGVEAELVYRQPVRLHHCRSNKAKDSNVVQALADRFAPGEPNKGKGTKDAPGWFHGFSGDVWQAYALAVYVADTRGFPTPAGAVE